MSIELSSRTFLGTFGLALLGIAGLFLVDEFLAKMDLDESQVEATRLFTEGQMLMKRGDNAEAVERISDAIAIERDNREYLETLAQAQLAAGKTNDAQATLTKLLASDSTDGRANLLMGRVLEKENRFEDGIVYFHRAINGRWTQDAEGNRKRARFELIDLLAKRNSKEELLAELLPMQEEAPHDLKTRAQIGDLFLQAGSPARAEDVFRGIEHDAPTDPEAYAGLGRAEFARGNYRTAERDFQTALKLAPANESARQHLQLCSEIMLLDPTQRGITPEARYQRSLKLVELAANDINQCTNQNPTAETRTLLDRAEVALKAHIVGDRRSDASEANLDLAEQLGQAGKKECKAATANTPLELVLAKVAQ